MYVLNRRQSLSLGAQVDPFEFNRKISRNIAPDTNRGARRRTILMTVSNFQDPNPRPSESRNIISDGGGGGGGGPGAGRPRRPALAAHRHTTQFIRDECNWSYGEEAAKVREESGLYGGGGGGIGT